MNVLPRQRYEGSGCLTVRTSDLLLEIDHADYSRPSIPSSLVSQLNVHLEVGLGLSLIGRRCEELLYAELEDLRLMCKEHSLELALKSVQVWNQLLNTNRPSFVSIPRGLTWKVVLESLKKISSFQLDVDLMEIQLDENLLEKLLELKHPSPDDGTVASVHQQSLSLLKSGGISFDRFSLSKFEMTLSVSCLTNPRQRRSFRLVPLENARLSFSALEHRDLSISWKHLLDILTRHYLSQAKRQALKILGSADVLGNPLGLLVDVSEGWTSFVEQRSVAGLMKNVAEGLRTSTAKMSNELGRLAVTSMDEEKTPKFLQQWTRALIKPTVGLVESKRRLPRSPGNLFGLIEVYSMDNAQGHNLFQQRFNQEQSKTERFLLHSPLSSTLHGILTTERVLLYHPISFDLVSSRWFDRWVNIPGVDETSLFAREIQRALDIFREEKFFSPEDEENDQD